MLTRAAPVSWPMTVTRPGSPPNEAMLSWSHRKAASTSLRAGQQSLRWEPEWALRKPEELYRFDYFITILSYSICEKCFILYTLLLSNLKFGDLNTRFIILWFPIIMLLRPWDDTRYVLFSNRILAQHFVWIDYD